MWRFYSCSRKSTIKPSDNASALHVCLVGCSNNHISHIETAQTKVSLSMLSKLALALDQDLDYFLLDTQYAKRDRLIDEEIAEKLSRCNTSTLLTVNQMLDLLLKQQEMNDLEKNL